MHYGSGAAIKAGGAGGALPFLGWSFAWFVFLGIFLVIVGVAMVRIARIAT